MERIREEINQVTSDSSNSNDDDDTTSNEAADDEHQAKEQSIHEQKILLFANDLVLRRLAREIQLERKRLAKERAQMENIISEKQEKLSSEIPLAVTVQDVRDYLMAKQQLHLAAITELETRCRQERQQVVEDKYVHVTAIDRLLNGDYFKTIRAYKNCKKNLPIIKEKIDSLSGNPERFSELLTCIQKEKELQLQEQELGLKIDTFHERVKSDLIPEIKEMERVILYENQQHTASLKTFYGEIAKERRHYKIYEGVLQNLINRSPDEALFTQKIPRMLGRYSKIDGTVPVASLRTLAYQMNSFALLTEPPSDHNKANVFAVRISDNVTRGTVPKYLLHLAKNDHNRWQIQSIAPALDNKQQQTKVRLYLPHTSKATGEEKTVARTIRQEPLQAHATSHQFHLIRLADALLEKEKQLHPIMQINDRTEEQDKAIRAEEKLYKGWSR